MGNSTPNQPGWNLHYFFCIQVCYRWSQKITHTNFQIYVKISLSVIVEIVDLALRAVIDSFEIYTINCLVTQKKIENSFIMSKALFGVAHPKQNTKNTIIIIIKGSFTQGRVT